MNTKIKFTRFLIALALALSALGVSATAALADQPVKVYGSFTEEGVITDVCPFPINVVSSINGFQIVFTDESGALTRIFRHVVEQDTFTANGKTLAGIPFAFNVELLFDGDGNVTHIYADGVTEKIPLPDGSLFISAGRLDFTNYPDAVYVLSPDKGNPGNIAGFCAALSP